MTAINRMDGRVIHHDGIDCWVAHFDKGAGKTLVMLGDDVLSEYDGFVEYEQLEQDVNDEWDIQSDEESAVIRASINYDGIPVDNRRFCVEIYQPSTDMLDYEFYEREEDAHERVYEINDKTAICWEDI